MESSICLIRVLLEMSNKFLQYVREYDSNLGCICLQYFSVFCSYRPLINFKRFIKSLIYIFDKFSNEEMNYYCVGVWNIF